jgi:tryptophan-rich sensory protein
MIYRLIVFLALNFGALWIGGLFTGMGVPSEWYVGLAKAPWTPPGWVFGFAWTSIMLLFSVYLAYLWSVTENKRLLLALFVIQWVLNVGWNPTFFYYHQVLAAFFIIVALTALLGFFLMNYYSEMKLKSALVLPYVIWLFIATSLNAYILVKN